MIPSDSTYNKNVKKNLNVKDFLMKSDKKSLNFSDSTPSDFSDSSDTSTELESEELDNKTLLEKEQMNHSLPNPAFDDSFGKENEEWNPSPQYESVYKIYEYFDRNVSFNTILCAIHQCYGDLREAIIMIAKGEVGDLKTSQLMNKPLKNDCDREIDYYS